MVWHLLTSEHVLKFVFETITDVSFLPGLVVLGRRGRHFECYIGLAQFITSFFYNLCDALDLSVFLPALQWHMLNNVFSITLGCFTLIYLMGNRNELRDHVLRYTVFSAVWVFQIKDHFWMEHSQYTVSVPIACGVLLFFRIAVRTPPYNVAKVKWGALALVVSSLFFYLSMDDLTDRFRLLHGLSQISVGVALYYLWQSLPSDHYKKYDKVLPQY